MLSQDLYTNLTFERCDEGNMRNWWLWGN